jgi:NAD(P)-dependent dehydrogenase (short-subunit alcohol dehydrogenase family)
MATKAIAVIAGVGPGTVSNPRFVRYAAWLSTVWISIYSCPLHVLQGASIARKFAATYPVALLARSPQSYQSVVQEITDSGGKAIGINTDVSSAASVKDAFAQIAQAFPGAPLAAAVYNVGGGFVRKPFLELTEEEFTTGYESNACVSYVSYTSSPLLAQSDMINVD